MANSSGYPTQVRGNSSIHSTRISNLVDTIERNSHYVVFTISLLYFYPAISSDTLYRDDNARAVTDIYLWITAGRPIADVVNSVFTLSGFTLNYSGSFLQVLALILAFLSIQRSLVYFRNLASLPATLPVVAFYLSIFFIQNISYSFDAFSMSLAMFLTTLAFSIERPPRLNSFLKTVMVLVLVCGLYQPMLNLFIGLAAIELTLLALTSPQLTQGIRQLAIRIGQYVVACLLYLLVIFSLGMKPENGHDNGIAFATLAETVGARFVKIAQFVLEGASVHGGILLVLAVFSLIVAAGVLCLLVVRRKLRPAQVVTIILAYGVGVLSIFGFLIVFETPGLGYRMFPTTNVFLSMSILVVSVAQRKAALFALLPIYLSVSVSFQTFAMLSAQEELDRLMMWNVSSDLAEMDLTNQQVRVFGATPRAPINAIEVRKNKFFEEIIRPASNSQAEAILLQLGIPQVAPIMFSGDRLAFIAEQSTAFCENSVPVSQNSFYQISMFENSIFVLLSNGILLKCAD